MPFDFYNYFNHYDRMASTLLKEIPSIAPNPNLPRDVLVWLRASLFFTTCGEEVTSPYAHIREHDLIFLSATI